MSLTEISASSLTVWTLTSRKVWQKSWTERLPRSPRNWRTFALAMPSKSYSRGGRRHSLVPWHAEIMLCHRNAPMATEITDLCGLLYSWLCGDKHLIALKQTTRYVVLCTLLNYDAIYTHQNKYLHSKMSIHPHSCLNHLAVPRLPPPPMYRLTASIYESSCKCSHLPSVVVSRNHTQVHKDTITWKHDKWPRSVVCRVLTVSLIHMNSCVNRIHTA